jgi:hypothetical protein
MLARESQRPCRMRPLALAALLSLAPAFAHAQLAPRSIALESGVALQSSCAAMLLSPVALGASWWIAEGLDLTARVGWAFAARTDGRAADLVVDAGGGLRWVLAARALGPVMLADVAVVQTFAPESLGSDAGVRLRAGVGLDAFVARGVAVGAAVALSGTVVTSGRAITGAGVALHVEAYF